MGTICAADVTLSLRLEMERVVLGGVLTNLSLEKQKEFLWFNGQKPLVWFTVSAPDVSVLFSQTRLGRRKRVWWRCHFQSD